MPPARARHLHQRVDNGGGFFGRTRHPADPPFKTNAVRRLAGLRSGHKLDALFPSRRLLPQAGRLAPKAPRLPQPRVLAQASHHNRSAVAAGFSLPAPASSPLTLFAAKFRCTLIEGHGAPVRGGGRPDGNRTCQGGKWIWFWRELAQPGGRKGISSPPLSQGRLPYRS
jgi:hypothetical protein